MSYPLAQINALPVAEFVRIVGPVFEHSPWIAEQVALQRPFASRTALHEAMCKVVQEAAPERQLGLIRAHPDLVGRAVLTAESQSEQAAAGLLDLSPDEVGRFARFNSEYQTRFHFPFVVCARLNRKESILAAFTQRLQNAPEQERVTALEEIFKIAELRLAVLLA